MSYFVDTLYISWRLPPLAAVFLQCSGRRRLADRQKESGGSENQIRRNLEIAREDTSALRRLFFFCRRRQIVYLFIYASSKKYPCTYEVTNQQNYQNPHCYPYL